MNNISIITTKELTTIDGSILEIGAIIKFDMDFSIYYNGFNARTYFFRNENIFLAGFSPVEIKDLDSELMYEAENDISNITPKIIATMIVDHLNNQFEESICKIVE